MKKNHRDGNSIKMSNGNKALSIICYVVIGIFAISCLFPFVLMISSSFMTEREIVAEGYKLFPKTWSIAAYKYLLDNPTKLINAYKVTITTTVIGTLLGLFTMSMAGYVLNRKDFKYRNFFSFFIYFTTLFSGGLVPSYILNVRYLHLKDSIWVMIIPGLISAWSIFLMRNFMKSIPDELYESATIDGAGAFTIYRKVFMPLAIPSLATIGLFLALGYWNQWYSASLYIDTPSKYPLQYYLQKMINQTSIEALASQGHFIDVSTLPTQSVKMATAVLTTGPIILLYPFVQRYFVSGLTIGSVKG
ncbi:carbohydrate ABC transporter permease [Lachnoclostridium phytofermentans]|uniref:Binding-protein-dependent transport systems inner membrane component n=1 Tax=Lachnoclostridium phytofermentans (strain ATCC 700394 / DSM 18823 / ISDg) TaxID=357809 RepID=A9KJS8_LACP7|nr:carbohydrate ABC transporter permease [Lachnoclostridium phytofermentans]ABX41083.1 binding-protein-dependent transport systems inner membrane component [Lachnoclostridium phytofermentans ISDg]